MLVISPDAAYVLKADGSTTTVDRPDPAPATRKRAATEHRATSRRR